tara:strand:+ start:820 stop:1509 length:690 start_codon:yes stop_codon:yes gene_type:complete
MARHIVTNGCSFTQELHLDLNDRWTTKIGTTKNLALGGGSNERIFHTTIEYMNSHDPDTLIIGWTDPDRFMLPNSNGSRVVVTPVHTFDENGGGDCNEHSKFYYKYCHNEFVNFKNTLQYMLHLQNYCKAKKIKLLYFKSFYKAIDDNFLYGLAKNAFMSHESKDIEHMGIQANTNDLKNLIAKLDPSIWIKELWYSMQGHCKDYPVHDLIHPGIEGSDHWANTVKEYL